MVNSPAPQLHAAPHLGTCVEEVAVQQPGAVLAGSDVGEAPMRGGLADWHEVTAGLKRVELPCRARARVGEPLMHQPGTILGACRSGDLLDVLSPFRHASWQHGTISSEDLPTRFCCRAASEFLRGMMCACPEQQMLVLCGSHSRCRGRLGSLPSLRMLTGGGAEHGQPCWRRMIDAWKVW